MDNLKIVLKDSTEITVDAVNLPVDIIKTCASKEAFYDMWSLLTEENISEMTVYKDDVKTVKMENYMLDSIQAVFNSDGTITAHFYLRNGRYGFRRD